MKKMTLVISIGLFLLALPVRAGINLLHEFAGGAADGYGPYGSLILSGSTLYGMTYFGGYNDYGTIFKVQIDGSGFTLLHEFAGDADDGWAPKGSLIIYGSTLYGMTNFGGSGSYGTIFKIQTNGSGFALLHEFAGGAADGAFPDGDLILSGSTLYGMTAYGGDSNNGTVFKIETNVSGFALLHKFTGGATDGKRPNGSLIISGSMLYGMTNAGGDSDLGTIFKIETDGTGYALLHEFAGGAADGSNPNYGSLILSGSTLYSMTRYGGDSNKGTIFNIQTNGTGFTLVHEFTGTDGAFPYDCSLIISGSVIYGMTTMGGYGNAGVIFKIQTDGSGFAQLHEFYSGADNAYYPYGHLILSGSTFYGMTKNGGANNKGVVFSLPAPSTSVDFIGTWDGQGVYYRNSISGAFVKLATPATLITAGDLDGDGIDDLIGIWPGQGGVWVKYSQSGSWAKLSSTARDFSAGDMNGDGRIDLVATWDGQGVYYRNSIGGAWVKMATPAEQVTAGDLDGDGKDDLIGIWPGQGGVWVKYSQSGSWAKLSSTAIDIACSDMNGDGRDDLVATWDGQGVYYRNSINGVWVMLATPATLVTAGDLDGDNKADVIGIWPLQDGVWVKYSQSGTWAKLSTTTARHIAAGHMRGGVGISPALLLEPFGGVTAGPGNLGYQDMTAAGPGDRQFQCQEEKNLTPQDQDIESALNRVPGPGEYGFQCLEQKNLVPGSGIKKEPKDKEQRRQ
jgi:uncharacterized repeat protein (TIGR03803 family)